MSSKKRKKNRLTGKPPATKQKPSRIGQILTPRTTDFFARYWELIFFLGYLIFLSILVLPKLPWDYDVGHNAILLTDSLRIWAGQVPYRDFYGWYGPLYHYLLALFVGLLGNNLYAIKFYIDFICPILSMGILILALRKFDFPAQNRAFILLASIALGLERIGATGSLRPFLPVLLIALWDHSRRRKKFSSLAYLFPGILLLYLFSPEAGVYLLLASMVFVGLSLLTLNPGRDRYRFLVYSGAGFLANLILFAILYRGSSWFKIYLKFALEMSANMKWAHGLPLPGWARLAASPLEFYYYLPLLIYGLGILAILTAWLRGRLNLERNSGIIVLIGFGVLLWNSTMMRVSIGHLIFSFLPAVIVAGLAWPRLFKPLHYSHALYLPLILIVGAGMKFFSPWVPPPFKSEPYSTLMGVRIAPKDKEVFDRINSFHREHPSETIAFPFKAFYYTYLEEVPPLRFDAPGNYVYPGYEEDYVRAIDALQAKYVICNAKDFFWTIPGRAADVLFDYLDQNYEPIDKVWPLIILQKRPQPAVIRKELYTLPGVYILDRNNGYRLKLKDVMTQSDLAPQYLEFATEFEYPLEFYRRYSMPIAEWKFDGRKWKPWRAYSRLQRMNIQKGKQLYRLYLNYEARETELEVTFPGPLNLKPSQIRVSDLKICQGINRSMPRDVLYPLQDIVPGEK